MSLPLDNGLLFVHMPKTAGTSFREALEKSIGSENMFFDYGVEAAVRTDLILEHLHPERKIYELGLSLAGNIEPFCLAGHFSLPKYAPLFWMKNTLLFLREPVQRFVSSYEHHRRFNGLEMSLEAFCSQPKHVNVQSRVVAGFPLEAIGFIGLQEAYSDSLQMFQAIYDIKVEEISSNVFDGKTSKVYQLDDELLARVCAANEREIQIYQRAKEMFVQRRELFRQGLPYMHCVVTKLGQAELTGWAVNNLSNEPVEISIARNGVVVGSAVAHSYRAALREKNMARYGYIGFDFRFRKPLAADDEVVCTIAATGQVLPGPTSYRAV